MRDKMMIIKQLIVVNLLKYNIILMVIFTYVKCLVHYGYIARHGGDH